MNQKERRLFLINDLLHEANINANIPRSESDQKLLLRALFNVRDPKPASSRFLKIQDDYLQEALREKGITQLSELNQVAPQLYIWRGDITTLQVDAIVNAANKYLLGCFAPNHSCIDNAIHTFSGIQLRLACDDLMKEQGGHEEKTGQAKITPAFNLLSRYVIHTVGPIISGKLTDYDRQQLASCYESCLKLADENQVSSIAFCCISTGEFHFPNDEAARIAVATVKRYLNETGSQMKVVFNVFKEKDEEIYYSLFK
ncbi:protein-ADP-ribose hydrolase [Streptococcus equinus]|uniref:protein-ADP-ribose hydrolase n=1 Tax=Streptococcus equinus TaxID=1335 RepID=UPI003BF8758A